MAGRALQLRAADADEFPEIVAMAGRALGWPPEDPNEAYFRWKHLENPAGPSPMWVAHQGGALIGVRVFLRWRFLLDGEPVRAVRAVDTATDPAAQGQGVFRALTEHAVAALAEAGEDLIFNTPNAHSRPGYLKMGWHDLGRLEIAARPSGIGGLWQMRGARAAAQKWSEPLGFGTPVAELDDIALAALCARPTPAGLVTARDPAHLRWRYGFEHLHYRAVLLGDDVAEGLAIVRVRRRGRARELTICELLAPEPVVRRRLVKEVARRCGADFVLLARGAAPGVALPVPGLGPRVTWRPLRRASVPPLHEWHLSLGDVELL